MMKKIGLFFVLILLATSVSALVSVTPQTTQRDYLSASSIPINITISGLTNVYGFQFDLSYNSYVLQFVSITPGSFLSNNGQDDIYCNYSLATGIIKNVFCTRTGGSVGLSGSGVLEKFIFRARTLSSFPATSNLILSNVKVSSPSGQSLSNSKQDGSVTITECSTGYDSRDCSTSQNCAGRESCVDGHWSGTCIISGYYCDTDCDGDSECSDVSCPLCACITGKIENCTAGNGCLGQKVCSDGVWDPCVSTLNRCDTNCDGIEDTCKSTPCGTCDCMSYETQTCYTGPTGTAGVGVCKSGTRYCSNGAWSSTCSGEVTPNPTELCDGLDNDCDIEIDEDFQYLGQGCVVGEGACQASGFFVCTQDKLDVKCNAVPGTPTTELCDREDNDCDGDIDENCNCSIGDAMTCGNNVGECEYGTQTCGADGKWSSCTGGVKPTEEKCDNKDNDCDGIIDNDLGTTTCGKGICSNTVYNCSEGVLQTCTPLSNSKPEACEGLLDEDCDGEVDEGCECLINETDHCKTGDGCDGTRMCVDGAWTSCVTSQYYCDSDCDGYNDCSDEPCDVCLCIESWSCTSWGACSRGVQTRTCTDKNLCGTGNSKPAESRTCSSSSSSSSSGSSRSSSSSTGGGSLPSCTEKWVCEAWGLCDADGLRRRTCSDNNDCGTSVNKPKELETCLYLGNCEDGIKNGDEEGIDCGGRCSNICFGGVALLGLKISALPVNAEILDHYELEVSVENTGDTEVNDLEIVADRWAGQSVFIKSLPAGQTTKQRVLLNIPGNPYENSLEVQLIKDNSLISTDEVSVKLSVPKYNLKLEKDPETGKIYQTVIVDNRGNPEREIEAQVTVNKGKETYLLDTLKLDDIEENEVYHQIDYLYQDLPPGDYEVEAAYYEKGEKVGVTTTHVVLGGDRKLFNMQYLFYPIIVIIVMISAWMFFRIYRRGE